MNEKQLNVNAGSAVKVEDNNDMEITTDKVIKKNSCWHLDTFTENVLILHRTLRPRQYFINNVKFSNVGSYKYLIDKEETDFL